ncbi:MAG: inorganic diphosphatase [Candidatus Aenigmatarchaeota archaeon]
MDPVKDLPAQPKPETVLVFVEVPKGCPIKYEWDKDLGVMSVDRYIYSPIFYPGDYGLVPQTHCNDGDPLDCIVLVSAAGYPGTVVECRPVAVMRMDDEKGGDDKIVAVPVKDPRFAQIKDLKDIPEHTVKEITHFFEVYKALEPKKWVKVKDWGNAEVAMKILKQSMELYKRMEK